MKAYLSITLDRIVVLAPKAKSNYRGYIENPAHQKFYIHFFIDDSNANISLHTLSCPKSKFGQLKAYRLMFALELSMKK